MQNFRKNGVYYAFIYIFTILFISIFLSVYFIDVANDVFAFSKPDKEIEVVIPENSDNKDVAKILYENKIIKYPLVFRLYSRLRHDTGEYIGGEYVFNTSQSYDSIRIALKKSK